MALVCRTAFSCLWVSGVFHFCSFPDLHQHNSIEAGHGTGASTPKQGQRAMPHPGNIPAIGLGTISQLRLQHASGTALLLFLEQSLFISLLGPQA